MQIIQEGRLVLGIAELGYIVQEDFVRRFDWFEIFSIAFGKEKYLVSGKVGLAKVGK